MKKAIITGASSGLGLEVGKIFAKKNFEVINLSRTKSQFQNILLDLSDDKSISKAIKQIKKNHTAFDVLILNSGIMPLGKVGEIEFNLDHMFKVNITGSIKLVNGLLDLAKKNKSDIVFVGSTASLKNEPVRVIGFHPGGFNSNLRGGIIK